VRLQAQQRALEEQRRQEEERRRKQLEEIEAARRHAEELKRQEVTFAHFSVRDCSRACRRRPIVGAWRSTAVGRRRL
jgi:ribosomal protein L9